ncbi:GPI-anchored protein LLG1-like [Cicer arietinum]|uniref:GPI-anchored protein LLG1-like n=1 Tax=Cicer arietinum TaxID=3827 RepID=A0A1S3DW88_CICAR|nr:GPI-anchored protein LLG1-like [Cicer arietinum]
MGSYTFFSSILYFFLLATLVSSSPFLSDDIFDNGASTGRALLQAKKACGVDFENQNYTILTSQCKGPQYPPKVCCEAFKEFACPFSDEINDMTTDCATVMFSYINIYGKYPPGLFANECKEGKEGLDCSQVKSTNSSNNPSTSFHVDAPHSMFIISIVAFFGFIFHLF